MTSAKTHDFDKPNLLKQIYFVSLRENRLRCYKYRPMKNPMILWKFVTSQKKFRNLQKKIPKMPHNTNVEDSQSLSKNWSQESSIDRAEVTHWHKNNIKSQIWH